MDQWHFFVNFLCYFGVSIPILLFGYLIFLWITPYREVELIREGAETGDLVKAHAAKAAAHDLGGKILGLVLVVASAIFNSVNLWDLVLWGIVGIVFQVAVFYLFQWLAPFNVIKEIPKGNVSVAIFSSRLHIAAGLLMAALISY
jgi:putative membrane protein